MKATIAPAMVLVVACECSVTPVSVLATPASSRTALPCLVAGCLSATPTPASVTPTSAVTALPVLVADCLCRPARVLTSAAAIALKITAPVVAATHGSFLAAVSASILPAGHALKTTMGADRVRLTCIWHRCAAMLRTATAAVGLSRQPLLAGHGAWAERCRSWLKRMRPRLL